MAVLGTPQNSATVAPVVEPVFLDAKVIPLPDVLGVPGVPELVVTKTMTTSDVDALMVLEQLTVAEVVVEPLQETPSSGVCANSTWTPGSSAIIPTTRAMTSASISLRLPPPAPLPLFSGSIPSRASFLPRRTVTQQRRRHG